MTRFDYFRPDPQEFDEFEIGLCYKPETPQADPNLYDVISCRGKSFVAYAGVTPLMLMLWATKLGYRLDIDESGEISLWTRNQKPVMDFFCVQQHEDFMVDYPRDAAIELASWM